VLNHLLFNSHHAAFHRSIRNQFDRALLFDQLGFGRNSYVLCAAEKQGFIQFYDFGGEAIFNLVPSSPLLYLHVHLHRYDLIGMIDCELYFDS
jgi:hypothetical protein